jgi:hypothetical protein
MMLAIRNNYRFAGYALIVVGFLLLALNHVSILHDNPWLIPEFMRIY